MSRPLRFVPPGSVVEITARTTGGRFLLTPSDRVNEIIGGCLGRAQALYPVKVFGISVMSNHLHMDLGPDDAQQLADFMRHFLGNSALELGRHYRWKGRFWARRYRAIPVVDPQAQLERLRYLLAQGVKEGLVEKPEDWPGIHASRPLQTGEPLRGVWVDRTAMFRAGLAAARARVGKSGDQGRAPEPPDESKFSIVYEVKLEPLPAFADLEPEKYRELVRDLCREIETAVRIERRELGLRAVLGVNRVLDADPHASPESSDQSPAPIVHAVTAAARAAVLTAYRAFVDAFAAAAAALRKGLPADFPENAFPPRGPFVTPSAAPA